MLIITLQSIALINIVQNFNDIDIKRLCLNHLRTQMALVGQEPRLFSGTIRENIALGLDNVTIEQIETACELANAAKFIRALPQVRFATIDYYYLF
jgi:ABC-type multidrug transport system fused ATPase/permease subunit